MKLCDYIMDIRQILLVVGHGSPCLTRKVQLHVFIIITWVFIQQSHKPTPRCAVGQQTLSDLTSTMKERLTHLTLANNTLSNLPVLINSLSVRSITFCHMGYIWLARTVRAEKECRVLLNIIETAKSYPTHVNLYLIFKASAAVMIPVCIIQGIYCHVNGHW